MDYNYETLRIELRDVLNNSFKVRNLDLIENRVKTFNRTDVDVKAPLDQAFRDILLNLLEEEVHVKVLTEFVDFCILSCRRGISSPTMPVVLLGDTFETLTLDNCETLFGFVEQNVLVWKEELFFTACKNNLLRLCNDLLRRLSRTTATVFCGKILLFLAKFFPFSERSGLNIVSEFNLENVTEYGTDPSEDIVTEIQAGDEKHVIDFTFYCKFWQLQDFFRNPNQCYNKIQWKVFSSHSASILSTFQGIKLDYVTSTEQAANVGYFAKYLTSQKLLDLQLHDVGFRRSVLLQFLIVFHYLTSTVKFKSDSYELKSDQKEWISAHTEKIYTLLRETPPDGDDFAKNVKHIMDREELWNTWKNNSCPDLKKKHSSTDNNEKRKEVDKPFLGDIIKEAHSQGKFFIGSGELTRLWNQCPNNLEACKAKDRDFLPSLEEYFAAAIEQLENPPQNDEAALLKDSNFGWRALRLLARRSPHFFSTSNTILNSLSTYLEMMVRKIAHEKPGGKDTSSMSSIQDSQIDNETDNILTEEEPGASEDLKPEDFIMDNMLPANSSSRRDNKNVSVSQLMLISEKLAPDWPKLAAKLGYKPDEIEFFKNENPTPIDQARNLLQIWFEDDEDATLDNLLYILEGLELNEAAETIRTEAVTLSSQ